MSVKLGLNKFKTVFSRKRTKQDKDIEKSHNIMILIKKTWQDLFSLKKFLISIFVMMLFPLIFISFETEIDFTSISINHAASAICISIVFPLFFWTIGLAFMCIIGVSGSSLIAEEVQSKTMLILVSKPIKRSRIFLGKYIALFIYGAILAFVAIFVLCWIAVLRYSANFQHFLWMIPFIFTTYLYALFILLIFVSITLAFSSIMKKSRNAGLIMIFLAIFSFFGMMLLKMFIGDFYEDFQIYHFDLGYHLANIYISFLEVFKAIPPVADWQQNFAMTTGVYETTSPTDPDQNINSGGMTKTNYYLPIFSLLIWISIAIVLLIYGLISLNKREL